MLFQVEVQDTVLVDGLTVTEALNRYNGIVYGLCLAGADVKEVGEGLAEVRSKFVQDNAGEEVIYVRYVPEPEPTFVCECGDEEPVADGIKYDGHLFCSQGCIDVYMSQVEQPRLIREIAREINDLWLNVNYAAEPYLRAMLSLDSIEDNYYFDSGDSVVRYFLANAGTWRGEDARRIKAELKALLK